MSKKTKKNEPELIEDSELDQASGGLLSTTQLQPTTLKIQPTVSKIEIGSLKAGDGSV